MNGSEIMQGLISRGYTPYHAAALAGHILQESGGNASALNKGEGANGLVQWRLSRWDDLQNYAKERGSSPSDPDTQLDFIGHEMANKEKRSSEAFRNSKDIASASAALKPFIRFGDDSAGARLNNSVGLLNAYDPNTPIDNLPSIGQGAAPQPQPTNIMSPVQVGALGGTPPAAEPTLADSLKGLGKDMGGAQPQAQGQPQQDQFAPLQQLQMGGMRPSVNPQAIAQALAKQYGLVS